MPGGSIRTGTQYAAMVMIPRRDSANKDQAALRLLLRPSPGLGNPPGANLRELEVAVEGACNITFGLDMICQLGGFS
jgi:hypothetical protein